MKLAQVVILAVAVVSMAANAAFADSLSLRAPAGPSLPGGIRPTQASGYVDPSSCAILGGAATRSLCNDQWQCWRTRCNLEEDTRDANCTLDCTQLQPHETQLGSCYECLTASSKKYTQCSLQNNGRWAQCVTGAPVGTAPGVDPSGSQSFDPSRVH